MTPDKPHIKLLLALCRITFTAEQEKEIGQIIPTVTSWKTFTRLAGEHGISALVWHNLDRMRLTGSLPEMERTLLQLSYLTSLARNTYLENKLAGAVEILAGAGINVVLLKGMALELTHYGNCGVRQMNDVDILIRRDRSMEAWQLLQNHGFVAKPFKSPLYKLIALYEGKHLPELYSDDLSLEIHHNLFPAHPELTVKMISESSSAEISRQKIYLPPPALHFLYLLQHMQYHEEVKGETQLRLYADLLLLTEKFPEEILTGAMADLAQQTMGAGYLAERLHLLSHFWGVEPGEPLSVLIQEIDTKAVRQQFRRFLDKPKENRPQARGETVRQTLRRMPGLHRKAIHLTGEIFPSLTFMKTRYNCRNRFTALAMYPVRWGRMIGGMGGNLFIL